MTSDSRIGVLPFLLPNFYFLLLFVTTPCTLTMRLTAEH
jgi:hypothetical protein